MGRVSKMVIKFRVFGIVHIPTGVVKAPGERILIRPGDMLYVFKLAIMKGYDCEQRDRGLSEI